MRSQSDRNAAGEGTQIAPHSFLHSCAVLPYLRCASLLLIPMTLSACVTRTLAMPPPELVASPAGPIIEVVRVDDKRNSSTLGKLDTITVDSGPDLVKYVEDELINSLSRLGFAVFQVEPDAAATAQKRLHASLLSAQINAESTWLHPVVASVRVRVELVNELGQTTYRRELRGANSRDLGAHTQGSPEDAKLLADTVDQALASLLTDKAFYSALLISPKEAEQRRIAEAEALKTARESRQRPTPLAKPTAIRSNGAAETMKERLSTLDQLLREGLIEEDDYAKKRQEILNAL